MRNDRLVPMFAEAAERMFRKFGMRSPTRAEIESEFAFLSEERRGFVVDQFVAFFTEYGDELEKTAKA